MRNMALSPMYKSLRVREVMRLFVSVVTGGNMAGLHVCLCFTDSMLFCYEVTFNTD